MKVLVLSEIVIIFAIYLQSENTVHSDGNVNSPAPDENTTPNLSSTIDPNQPIENPSSNIAESSPNEPSRTDVNGENPSSNILESSPTPPLETVVDEAKPSSNMEPSPTPPSKTVVDEEKPSSNMELLPNMTLQAGANENNETQSASISLNTTESTKSNNNADDHFIVIKSKEIVTIPEEQPRNEQLRESNAQEVASIKNKPHKSVVELLASHTYNNSFVLTSLLNFSRDKYDISPIGEPVNLFGFIENLVFGNIKVEFHEKLTNYSNIHASGIPSPNSVLKNYNNFTCKSQHFEIALNVIPENMTFEGDYTILDTKTNETTNGTFIFHQFEAELLYKTPNISELHTQNPNLTKNGDIIFSNGQMKFTQLCENQCELMAASSSMFTEIKSHILKKMNVSFISRPVDQFISAFPFLSICASSSSTPQRNKSPNYYIIEETVVLGKDTPVALHLGPMIIKGLDNFTNGNVVAMKGHLRESPNYFLISTQASQIQGQCDWRLPTENSRHSAINHSFTFIIEHVDFSLGVDFSNSWSVDYLHINLDGISIHRLDKSCPKILGFIKMVLEDFVHSAVKNSLIGLFNQYFPKLVTTTSTTTDAPTKKTKSSALRKVVYLTPSHPIDDVDITSKVNDHLPFPTRRVFTPCKDTRKWWQKLFYRNKCKDKVREYY